MGNRRNRLAFRLCHFGHAHIALGQLSEHPQSRFVSNRPEQPRGRFQRLVANSGLAPGTAPMILRSTGWFGTGVAWRSLVHRAILASVNIVQVFPCLRRSSRGRQSSDQASAVPARAMRRPCSGISVRLPQGCLRALFGSRSRAFAARRRRPTRRRLRFMKPVLVRNRRDQCPWSPSVAQYRDAVWIDTSRSHRRTQRCQLHLDLHPDRQRITPCTSSP